MVDKGRGDIGRLKKACGHTHRCIGESDVWGDDFVDNDAAVSVCVRVCQAVSGCVRLC